MERLIIGIDKTKDGQTEILIGKCEGIITSCINKIEGPMADIIVPILKGEIKCQ